jgi:hypothetical protein
MKPKKISTILFIVGIIYLVLFFDTLLSKQSESFKFLSIETSKEINLTIFLILAIFLIYTSFKRK